MEPCDSSFSFWKEKIRNIDEQGKKSRGSGSSDFCQNPWGDQCFVDSIATGILYFGLYCIFVNRFVENISVGGPIS
jgi:hypothetical protein